MRYVEFEMDDEEFDPRWGGDGDVRTMQRHKSRSGQVAPRAAPKRRSPLDHIRARSRCVVHPDLPLAAYSSTIPREAILRVVTAPIDCPICISTSSVPRMLECGHIMCLPCYYRFLRHSPDNFCPVCGDYVSGDLIPVSFLEADPMFMPKEGDELVLRLMRRQGPVVLPTDEQNAQKPRPDMLLYSRVVCATLPYLRQEYVAERDTLELEQREAQEIYGDDEGYPQALDAIRKKLQSKLERLKPGTSGTPSSASGSTTPGSTPAFSFYQTAFESPVTYVLSPLDVSVLKSAFGGFDNLPSTIITKVENIIYTSFEQDPTQRKWFRYLSHLPDTAPLGILECDWRGTLEPELLKKYARPLSERRAKTMSKRHREEERRIRAQTEMDELFRMSAHDSIPLAPDQLEIDKDSLPTLGGAAQPAPKPKQWNKNFADLQDVQQLLSSAKEVKGKKGKVRRLVLQ